MTPLEAFHAGVLAAQAKRAAEASWNECATCARWYMKEHRAWENDLGDDPRVLVPLMERRHFLHPHGWWSACHVREAIEKLRALRGLKRRRYV